MIFKKELVRSLALGAIGIVGVVSASGCAFAQTVAPAPGVVAPPPSVPASHPNILWIIAEDMGPQLGCYGYKINTPNIDALAAQGARYTRAYTTSPVCSPSRSAFMTGMYQYSIASQNHRTKGNEKRPLPEGVRTLPLWLDDAGYFSANIVQMPAGVGFKGTGKNDWNFITDVSESWKSKQWNDLKGNQPFYAQISFKETHRVFRSPEKTDPAKVEIAPYYPDHPVTRQDWAKYLDSVMEVDRKVGVVLNQLEKDGLADDTVVVFFADHGEANVRAKQFLYEEGLHVPLIIRWPKNFPAPAQIKPGLVDDRFIEAIDLAPTMIDIAGLKKPDKMQGRIFLGARAGAPRTSVFAGRDRMDETVMHIRAVRNERYRYLRNFTPEVPFLAANKYKESQYPVWNLIKELNAQGKLTPAQAFLAQPTQPPQELYDLQNDPWEIRNLAEDPKHQATLQQMRALLQKSLVEAGDKAYAKQMK